MEGGGGGDGGKTWPWAETHTGQGTCVATGAQGIANQAIGTFVLYQLARAGQPVWSDRSRELAIRLCTSWVPGAGWVPFSVGDNWRAQTRIFSRKKKKKKEGGNAEIN